MRIESPKDEQQEDAFVLARKQKGLLYYSIRLLIHNIIIIALLRKNLIITTRFQGS